MAKSDSIKLKNTNDFNYSVGAFNKSFVFAPGEVIEFTGEKANKYAKGILDNPEIEGIEETTANADQVIDVEAEATEGETPAEETPAEVPAVEETPAVEEAPVEEAPAEEVPAEETPAVEPVEEAKVEETPAEEAEKA